MSHNNPNKYQIESQIATLIDELSLEEFENKEACILLYKDYSVASGLGSFASDNVMAKVYLHELPEHFFCKCRKKMETIRRRQVFI